MEQEDRLAPGKPIPARILNLLVEGAERLANRDVAAPLALSDIGAGAAISSGRLRPFPVTLSGSGPGYSWAEAYPKADGSYASLTGGRTGTSNAYEVNAATGLAGKVVAIEFTDANDYRFQLIRDGGTPGTLCFAITGCPDGYAGGSAKFPVPWATVTASTTPTGATATATRTGGSITAIAVTNGGTGYASAPTVTLTGGGAGTGATATATVSGGAIASISVTNGGTGYTSAPSVSFFGGGSTVGTCTPDTLLSGAVVKAGGTGYTAGATVSFSGGGGSGATARANVSGTGVVTSITVITGGIYATTPTVTISGAGTGATATATIAGGSVTAIAVTNGGTGYSAGPTATVSGGGGTGALAAVGVTSGGIGSVTILDGGTGYTTRPTIAISGGGGSGAIVAPTLVTKCCVPFSASGTLSYVVAATGMASVTGTQTVIAGTTTSLPIAMGVDAATYACIPNCFNPLPKTLYVTNALGSAMPMTYTSGLWTTGNIPFTATVTSLDNATGHCFATFAGTGNAFFWFRPAVNTFTFADATSFASNFAVIDCCLYAAGGQSNFLDQNAAGGFTGGTQVSAIGAGCSMPYNKTHTLSATYVGNCGNSLSTPGGASHTVTE